MDDGEKVAECMDRNRSNVKEYRARQNLTMKIELDSPNP